MFPVQIPEFWEPLLKGYVKKTFYAGTRRKDFADREEFTEGDYRFFAKGVAELNLAFTRERQALPKNYFNRKELRSGYILYFLPVNALKVASLLRQLPPNQFVIDKADGGKMKVIDIGSGPGTGMLGTMLYLENLLRGRKGGKIELKWILIDQSRQVLNDASVLYERALAHLRESNPAWSIESELQLVVGDLFSQPLPRFLEPQGAELILSLNLLSELPKEKRLPVVEGLLRNYLHKWGKILILEPALQKTTRELMELHDEIIERNSGVIYAPCLHQAACPMLAANRRDWCHTYIPWERPEWIEKIDRMVGIRKDYLKCSYLLLGTEPVKAADDMLWRVVSGPLNSRGKSERLLCGEAALPRLLRVTRLDRDRSPANEGFDRLERGDIVQLAKIDRIRKETPVRKVKT
jgi:hypothetical protein